MGSSEGTPLPTPPGERRRRIRKRAITGSLAAFGAIWAVIFGQLASGHDPALAKTDKQQPAAATAAPHSSSASPLQSAPLDPVTTQQS